MRRSNIPTLALALALAVFTTVAGDATAGAAPDAGNTPPADPVRPAAPGDQAAPAAPLDPELARLVDGVTAYYDKVQHLKAKFRQVVKQKTLSRTKKASGTIEFAKPGRMRWEYQRPDRVLYVSDGEVLWTYQPEDALVYKARIQGSRLYHALRFLFGMGDLRKSFDIAMGPAHGPDTAFLVLTPRDGHQDYKELALVVDRKTFEIRESFLTDPLGNVTQYIFDELDYETEIPAGRFGFTPPAGATVQEL